MQLDLLVAAASDNDPTWWSEHSTLIVGVVGIVVSGFIGPSVTGWWTDRRERTRQHRDIVDSRRADLRVVLDEAAVVLAGAVTNLRPLLEAEIKGEELPKEPSDFLKSLVPLGQRLRLRLPERGPVVERYDEAVASLREVATALSSQDAFDKAAGAFETKRDAFLEAGRKALFAPIDSEKEL